MNQLVTELNHPDRVIRGRAAISLGSDVGALPVLLQALRTETDVFVREDITWSLARMGDLALLPLLHLLFDRNAATRLQAAHTLGKIGDARAVSALASALQDSDRAVVMKAAFALGQIGDARAVPALIRLLSSEDDEIQAAAVEALVSFGSAAVTALAEVLEDTRWEARLAAVSVLGEIGGARAKQAAAGLRDDPDAQVRAVAARIAGG
jgi:HEAT repeat protein